MTGASLVTKVSPLSVADTVARLSALVAERGLTPLAAIDPLTDAVIAG